MPKLQIASDDLVRIASAERIVTASALRGIGVSAAIQTRLVRNKVLHQLAPGVLSIGAPSWLGYVAAGLHIAGDGAAAFGRTSLALHGIEEPELPVHVLSTRAVQPRSRPWVVFHRSDLAQRRLLDQHELRRVALEDSILDALGQVEETSAIAMVTRAIQERRTTAKRLLGRLGTRSRVAHRDLVRGILLDGAGIESVLEYAYVDRVEGAHGLEPMVRQYVVPETGHRADGGYPDRKALIHLDGARYHDPEADRILDLRHAGFGYTSARITWYDCWIDPCATARRLVGGEPPRSCRRCATR